MGRFIDALDQPRIEDQADDLGYEPTDSGEWIRRSWPPGAVVRWERTSEEVTTPDGSTKRQYVLTETIGLSISWLWALFVASILALCWIYLPAGHFVWAACVGTYFAFSSAFAIYPSPLDSYLDHLRDPDTTIETALSPQDYKTSCVGPSLTALLSGIAVCGPLFVAGLPLLVSEIRTATTVDSAEVTSWIGVLVTGGLWMAAFCLISLGVGLLIYLYEDADVRIRVFPFDLLARSSLPTPELSGGYLTLLVVAIIPVFALTHSTFLLPVVNRLTTTEMVLYFLTPPTLLIASLLFFLHWWVIRNRQYVYDRTIDRLSHRKSVSQKVGTMITLTVASYFLFYTTVSFFEKFQAYLVWPVLNRNPLPILDTPVLVFVLLVALLPASYFFLGLSYQLIDFVRLLWKTYVTATPVATTPRVDATRRVLDSDDVDAYALGVGPLRTVVVSSHVEDLLTDDEFDAIVAHEEGHLDPDANEYWLSDGTVSLIAPILGTLTLTGKNIVYALLDFRDRERAADRYAANRTSPEALASALETLDDATGAETTPAAASFVPAATPISFVPAARPRSTREALERYFGLLFGSFALVRAHPDISERLSALDGDAAIERTISQL